MNRVVSSRKAAVQRKSQKYLTQIKVRAMKWLQIAVEKQAKRDLTTLSPTEREHLVRVLNRLPSEMPTELVERIWMRLQEGVAA